MSVRILRVLGLRAATPGVLAVVDGHRGMTPTGQQPQDRWEVARCAEC